MKKLLITGAAAGLLLVSATAAFAATPVPGNNAFVINNVGASSVTGENYTSATKHGTNKVVTGNAYSLAGAGTLANTNVGSGNASNNAFVINTVGASSSTGGNNTTASGHGTNTVTTGNAGSTAVALTVVNTNVSFGFPR